ncbi:putative NAD(+)--arginine ADP-ribosyltransferase Mav [Bubalus bubalis]|uniref:putative NAD(+)--arginine ADP-ribosyltransferase Mav n=1 Tax=Bubalus bubalis TaxID=89462 RepID=UPI001E1B66DA|nr:putative NAD(+)--arginine ADP-ribosyltransferase Mav [Bubalus bubalis]
MAQHDPRLCLKPHYTSAPKLQLMWAPQVCSSPLPDPSSSSASVSSRGGSQGSGLATSRRGAAASLEGAMQALKTPDQPPEEILRPPAASRADAAPACSICTHAGNSPLTDPAAWPDVGVPCVIAPWLELSPAWSSTWAPFVCPLWMGHPLQLPQSLPSGPQTALQPRTLPYAPFPQRGPLAEPHGPRAPSRSAAISSSSDPSPATRPNQGTHACCPGNCGWPDT